MSGRAGRRSSLLEEIMPKSEEKHNKKGCWTEENMKHAMNDVLMEKISIREAVRVYGVPKSSLHDRINKIKKGKEANVPPKSGRFELTFSETCEEELLAHIRHLDGMFMPLSKKEFLKLAYNLAVELRLPHSETETLGHVLGFCKKGELLRNNRHHHARTAIANLLRNRGWEVDEEIHCVSEDDSHRRVDIIAINMRTQKAMILDPTLCFERGTNQALQINDDKRDLYSMRYTQIQLNLNNFEAKIVAGSGIDPGAFG
ncbi:hypothetical protein ANN_23253 [Periplaneta americana]|uniref:HTH psq-type domain-containing protein n=1 Tax=Periplaneta americana TaxID=6978 RepID=A0ABQ8SMM0_PERAM|nr:hypothetical protein ANN_23253 [Periplaneta americana]